MTTNNINPSLSLANSVAEWRLHLQASTPLVIATYGLTKTYKGVQALRPLDLQVQQDTICGFLGPNGAGKTTTIKLLFHPHPGRCPAHQ